MIPDTLVKELQRQMNVERQNEAVYMQLAGILDNLNWAGSAKFMYKAADEERSHFAKQRDWLIENNITPQLEELQAVSILGNEPDDIVPYYEAALKLEKETTSKLEKLYQQAEEEHCATAIMLQWFQTEQVESEHVLIDILSVIKRLDKYGQVLWDLEFEG